jgi:hypothetical protein
MGYFDDEIIGELSIGKIFNSRQIDIFLRENKNCIVLSDDEYLPNQSQIQYEVIDKQKKYIHSRDDRPQLLPNPLLTVYIIKKV